MRELHQRAGGIPHGFEVYDGDHRDRLVERIERIVLPLFSQVLER